MAKQRTERGQAALVLDAELTQIEYSLKVAAQLTSEQMTDYFGEFDPVNDETARLKLLFEYKANELKSNVILDYVSQALKTVQAIQRAYEPGGNGEQ